MHEIGVDREHHWLVAIANFFGIPAESWSNDPFNPSSQDNSDFYSVWVITPGDEQLVLQVRHCISSGRCFAIEFLCLAESTACVQE